MIAIVGAGSWGTALAIHLGRGGEALPTALDPGLVGAAGDVTPPFLMVEIPAHRLDQPAFETHAATAAEFVC